MQKVDTAELRRLHEATTKGKWRHFRDEFVRGRIDRVIAAPGQVVLRDEDIHRHAWKDDPRVDADWDFIAAAHNALPALLDELEAAREALSQIYWKSIGLGEDRGDSTINYIAADALKGDTSPLHARDRRMKLIGAAEELEKVAKDEWQVVSDGGNPILIVGRLQQRAAQLRLEADDAN